MSENTKARDKFITDLTALWAKLELSPQPTPEVLRAILDLCTTTRGKAFRFLQRPRKATSNEASVLFERLRWHNVIPGGTGWLGGPINSTWMVDTETFDRLDTFATLIGLARGKVSWTDEWSKALGL